MLWNDVEAMAAETDYDSLDALFGDQVRPLSIFAMAVGFLLSLTPCEAPTIDLFRNLRRSFGDWILNDDLNQKNTCLRYFLVFVVSLLQRSESIFAHEFARALCGDAADLTWMSMPKGGFSRIVWNAEDTIEIEFHKKTMNGANGGLKIIVRQKDKGTVKKETIWYSKLHHYGSLLGGLTGKTKGDNEALLIQISGKVLETMEAEVPSARLKKLHLDLGEILGYSAISRLNIGPRVYGLLDRSSFGSFRFLSQDINGAFPARVDYPSYFEGSEVNFIEKALFGLVLGLKDLHQDNCGVIEVKEENKKINDIRIVDFTPDEEESQIPGFDSMGLEKLIATARTFLAESKVLEPIVQETISAADISKAYDKMKNQINSSAPGGQTLLVYPCNQGLIDVITAGEPEKRKGPEQSLETVLNDPIQKIVEFFSGEDGYLARGFGFTKFMTSKFSPDVESAANTGGSIPAVSDDWLGAVARLYALKNLCMRRMKRLDDFMKTLKDKLPKPDKQ
jgi:hypothetical protein